MSRNIQPNPMARSLSRRRRCPGSGHCRPTGSPERLPCWWGDRRAVQYKKPRDPYMNVCDDLITDVKMPPLRDPALLAKAARLYFVDDRSQDDVAAILGTTRSNVSRMLKQARDLGIVEIRIVDPTGRDPELEAALRQ